MAGPELVPIVERDEARAAIVFVHGFGGSAKDTWGQFPELLSDVPALSEWSIYSLGYSSRLSPDWHGVWTADPGIETLATYLNTRAEQKPLKSMRTLAFIAHSMGGLVVQKALLDFPDLVDRVSHVLLYGTPSGGTQLAQSRLGRFLKRQAVDMGSDSDFIRTLRRDWRGAFGDVEKPGVRSFGLWAIAGDRDDFVSDASSMGPFAKEDCVVVPGNHLEIVTPKSVEEMSVQTAIDALVGDAAPGGPWNAARVAIERSDFQLALERLEPNAGELDEQNTVYLAIALEAVGRRDDAVNILQGRRAKGGTDAMGTLAGRLKRMWWKDGIEKYAKSALELYRDAYRQSAEKGDHEQAFYHGINVAFMTFAFEQDEAAAKEMAERVLGHCAHVTRPDPWCYATMGEANLYLGDTDEALRQCERAVALNPDPWQMKSMFDQAMHVAEAMGDKRVEEALSRIFRHESG